MTPTIQRDVSQRKSRRQNDSVIDSSGAPIPGSGGPTGSNGQPLPTVSGIGQTSRTPISSRTSTGPPSSETGLPGPGTADASGSNSNTEPGASPIGPGTGSSAGSAPSSTREPGATGSGGGDVNGPGTSSHGLNPAVIVAILFAALILLSILAVAARLLWRRHRERRAQARPGISHLPPSDPSFTRESHMAERLRGGLINPYTGAASQETLPSQYRIEPFAVPPRRPPLAHARTSSTTWLLDDSAGRNEKNAAPSPRFLPRGAMDLAHHGHTYAELGQMTPLATPAVETETMVFELPPTYASLSPPQSVPPRPWYRFWDNQ